MGMDNIRFLMMLLIDLLFFHNDCFWFYKIQSPTGCLYNIKYFIRDGYNGLTNYCFNRFTFIKRLQPNQNVERVLHTPVLQYGLR